MKRKKTIDLFVLMKSRCFLDIGFYYSFYRSILFLEIILLALDYKDLTEISKISAVFVVDVYIR